MEAEQRQQGKQEVLTGAEIYQLLCLCLCLQHVAVLHLVELGVVATLAQQFLVAA
jgi:hypothetical protein